MAGAAVLRPEDVEAVSLEHAEMISSWGAIVQAYMTSQSLYGGQWNINRLLKTTDETYSRVT
jgi:hypothetical protein